MVEMRGGRSCLGQKRLASSITVASVVVLMVLAAAPAKAGSEEAEFQRYRNELISAMRGMTAASMGTLYWNDEVHETTIGQIADLYAQRAMAAARLADSEAGIDSKGNEKGRNGDSGGPGGGTASGQDPVVLAAGTFYLWERLSVTSGNPTVACSNLAEEKHYTAAVPLTEGEDLGVAFSDVSTHPGGFGYLNDFVTGNRQAYNMGVYYGGVSDFFCVEGEGVGGQYSIVNNPTVYAGFVIGATD